MVLSDIANLKVEVHKLAVAVESLAIRRYVQGEIDIDKLPWFTQQYVPGDSIKLCARTVVAHAKPNETMGFPSNLKDNEMSKGANQMFDEISQPVSSNPMDGKMICDAHQVFEELPIPAFILEMAQPLKLTQQREDIASVHQVFDTMSEQSVEAKEEQMISNVGANSHEYCRRQTEDNTTEYDLVADAHNMFNEVPLPNSHPYISQPIQFMRRRCAPAPQSISIVLPMADLFFGEKLINRKVRYHDNLASNHLDFELNSKSLARLNKIDFRKVLNVWHANLKQLRFLDFKYKTNVLKIVFKCLQRYLFMSEGILFVVTKYGWKSHISYKEAHSWGKLCTTLTPWGRLDNIIELHSLQRDSILSFNGPIIHDVVISYILGCIGYVHKLKLHYFRIVIWRIMMTDVCCVVSMGRSNLPSSFTLEDKVDFRSKEDITERCTWELFNPQVIWCDYKASWSNESIVFLTNIFYRDDLAFHEAYMSMKVLVLLDDWFINKSMLLPCSFHLILEEVEIDRQLSFVNHVTIVVSGNICLFRVVRLETLDAPMVTQFVIVASLLILHLMYASLTKCFKKQIGYPFVLMSIDYGIRMSTLMSFWRLTLEDMVGFRSEEDNACSIYTWEFLLNLTVPWYNGSFSKIYKNLMFHTHVLDLRKGSLKVRHECTWECQEMKAETELFNLELVDEKWTLFCLKGNNGVKIDWKHKYQMLKMLKIVARPEKNFVGMVKVKVKYLSSYWLKDAYSLTALDRMCHAFGIILFSNTTSETLVSEHQIALVSCRHVPFYGGTTIFVERVVFDPGGDWYLLILTTSCASLLTQRLFGSDFKSQSATILIFDPGGFTSWLEMMNRPKVYKSDCNYEDYEIYVFDP